MNRLKILVLLGLPLTGFSIDFGIEGYVFSRDEKKELRFFVEQEEHLVGLTRSLDLLMKTAESKIKLESVPHAKQYRRFTIDPTFKMPVDVVTPEGKTLFWKGTKINPLQIHPLRSPVLLLDGNDTKQLEWAANECPPDSIWIVATGDESKAKRRNHIVSADVEGVFMSRFQVKALPAIIKQKGDLFEVEEIPMKRSAL